MEQYVNVRAREFVQKYMLEKPVEFYRSLLELMLSEGRIKDNIDLKISAQEFNYGLLGISLEFAFVRQTGADVEAILKKFQTMLISYLID